MRKLAVAAAGLAVLAAVVLGVALWSANRLVARYKPTIEALASDAVGAPVTIGRVSASVIPSARVEVGDVAVGGADGVTLGEATLHLRLLPLLSGRLDVRKLGLERPRVVLLRDADGVTVEGIPRRPKAAPGTPSDTPGTREEPRRPAPPVALTFRELMLRDATVVYRDEVRRKTFTVSEIDGDAALEVNADGVHVPEFEGAAKVEATVVEAEGKDLRWETATEKATFPSVTVTVNGQEIRVAGVVDARGGAGEMKVTSGPLDLAKLAAAVAPFAPALQETSPTGRMTLDTVARFGPGDAFDASGRIVLAEVAAKTGANAVSDLAGTVDLRATATERRVGSQQLQLRMNGEPVTASFAAKATDDVAALESLVAQVFGGTARASGTFTPATRRFTADLGAERLDVAKALAALEPARPNPLSGTLARFSARLAGTAADTPEATRRSVTGNGSLLLENGRYAGVNLLSEVLKAVRAIPFLSRALPGDVRRLSDGDATDIGTLRADFALGGAAIRLANLVLTNPALAFEGGGRVGFDRRVDLAGTVALSPSVSKSIAGDVKEIRVALDPVGRLAVPVTIAGAPPKVVVVPDVTRLVTGTTRALIENKATELLLDALGGKKGKKGGKKGSGGTLPFRLPNF